MRNNVNIKESIFLLKNGLLKGEEEGFFKKIIEYYNQALPSEKISLLSELQQCHINSREFINLIIYDSTDVVKEFIQKSISIPDENLIALINDTYNPIKLKHIALRKNIGEKLRATLMENSDKTIKEMLKGSKGILGEKSKASKGKKLVGVQKKDEIELFKMNFSELSDNPIFQNVKNEINILVKNNMPNYSFLIRYVCKGMLISYMYLLAKKVAVPFSTIHNIFVVKKNLEQQMEMLEKSGMPRNFAIVNVKIFGILAKGIIENKINNKNLKTYLLKNIKDINHSGIVREIIYVEKMI